MKDAEKNYVSVWFWLLALMVMAIPAVNVVMAIVWAFAGENESRKNYFRALIVIFLIWLALFAAFVAFGLGLGLLPGILKWFNNANP
jgi:ABC-type Fe3+ transport system permease subunit